MKDKTRHQAILEKARQRSLKIDQPHRGYLEAFFRRERLVTTRRIYAMRADIETLCPGKVPSDKIIALATEKIRCVQKTFGSCAVWALPPSFTEDVFLGATLYELMQTYCNAWMEPWPTLKYIYVPTPLKTFATIGILW